MGGEPIGAGLSKEPSRLLSLSGTAGAGLAMSRATSTENSTGAELVIVDDEPDLREMLREYLEPHGYRVRTAAGGGELRAHLAERPADLVLLDVRMPGEDGLSLARWVREHSNTAIIMVTSAGETVDRVVGLEIGADDYVVKPFDLRELRARIASVLRRTASGPAAGAIPGTRVHMGKAWLDIDGRRLIGEDGEAIRLTNMEFDLLQAFATHPNRVLTRNQLLDLAHNKEWEPFDRSIDVRVTRIRRKIEPDPSRPQVIKTVHGAGYIFVTEPRG